VAPGKLKAICAQKSLDHMIAQALDPVQDRQQPFLGGAILLRLAGLAIP
jgi:hypothetical protein